MNSSSTFKQELVGWGYGLVGVIIFSLTLPATSIAVAELDPAFVGLGRAVIAGSLAVILLIATRQTIPPKRFLPQFVVVAVGVIVGFPLLTAIAMKNAPATYGAVIVGLLPLATALFGVWRGKERVDRSFWIFALVGSGLVVSFALTSENKSLTFTDFALFCAVIVGGMGYAEGAVLARTFGGWQVICWSLVLTLPLLLPIVIHSAPTSFNSISLDAWLGLAYVGIFSMFLGFFAWYRGLAWGGIARVSQIQLIQPFLTIITSGILLNEPISLRTFGFAFSVVACVVLGKQNFGLRSP